MNQPLQKDTSEGFVQDLHFTKKIHRFFHAHPTASPLFILIFSALVFWTLIGNRFIAPLNLSIILQQVTIIGIIAIAQSLVILTSGIDLSVGAIMVFSSVVMGRLAVINGLPVALAFSIGLIIGVLCGFLNGVLITKLRMPPFIVTLGTWYIYQSLNLFYSKSETIRSQEIEASAPFLQFMGRSFDIGGGQITFGALLMIVLFFLVMYVLRFTPFGKHVHSIGSDIHASKLVGIRTDRTLIAVYSLAGFICAIGGWTLIGRIGSVSPQAGTTANIESITAVVIGGISLFGGRGRIMGTLLGALIVGMFRNFLALRGVDVLWQVFAVGILSLTDPLVCSIYSYLAPYCSPLSPQFF